MANLKEIYAKVEPFYLLKAIRRSKVFKILTIVSGVTSIITEHKDPRAKRCGNKCGSTRFEKSVISHLITRRILLHNEI